jgi:hypothetical protein
VGMVYFGLHEIGEPIRALLGCIGMDLNRHGRLLGFFRGPFP